LKEGRSCDEAHHTVPLYEMLDDYYHLRGYDHQGIPSAKTLRKLGIEIKDPGVSLRGKGDFRFMVPKGKWVKRSYISIMLWFVGRAMQAAAKVDKGVKKEFETIPKGFRFSLGVSPGGPAMVMEKTLAGRVKYVGSKPKGKPLDLQIKIKHLEGAILLFTFQESTAVAVVRDRLVMEGDMPRVCTVVRILDMMAVLLLPKIVAELAVKRYPAWSPLRKHLGRWLVYTRAVLGF
jgi:hypothetical protein